MYRPEAPLGRVTRILKVAEQSRREDVSHPRRGRFRDISSVDEFRARGGQIISEAVGQTYRDRSDPRILGGEAMQTPHGMLPRVRVLLRASNFNGASPEKLALGKTDTTTVGVRAICTHPTPV